MYSRLKCQNGNKKKHWLQNFTSSSTGLPTHLIQTNSVLPFLSVLNKNYAIWYCISTVLYKDFRNFLSCQNETVLQVTVLNEGFHNLFYCVRAKLCCKMPCYTRDSAIYPTVLEQNCVIGGLPVDIYKANFLQFR